jgi:hypothetical protein
MVVTIRYLDLVPLSMALIGVGTCRNARGSPLVDVPLDGLLSWLYKASPESCPIDFP